MAEIILSTLNAKYIHASFGLRYLRANLGELRERSQILEFNIGQRALEIVERIAEADARIVGFGVYIWNVVQTTEVVALLKKVCPQTLIVLGGPEVSYETQGQEIVRLADHVVTGEADLAFRDLCRELLAGGRPEKIRAAALPAVEELALPYSEYEDEDLANRIVYVEASRGCPFSCEFCLSSLDIPVRAFPTQVFLGEMDRLLGRGLLHFKFVDRTFNLNLQVSRSILEFFIGRLRPGLFLHFELVPDRLPEDLREVIERFPKGVLQFEVGVQTFNPEVAANISRRQDYGRLEDALAFLRRSGVVHVHADLIAGLPGEGADSFAAGFDRLHALGPQEIQVGILKRLRGTPIGRHDEAFGMVYSPLPPYELLHNRLIPFREMQQLRRFARNWELIANSGNFVESSQLLWRGEASVFAAFLEFSEWYHRCEGRHHGVALVRTMERVLAFLVEERGVPGAEAAACLWADYQRGGRGELPPFLRPWLPQAKAVPAAERIRTANTGRQLRHRG